MFNDEKNRRKKMCMGATVTPTPVQSAPQVTPPAQSPDGGASGTNAANLQRKRAMMAAGSMGAGNGGIQMGMAPTTKNPNSQGLLS